MDVRGTMDAGQEHVTFAQGRIYRTPGKISAAGLILIDKLRKKTKESYNDVTRRRDVVQSAGELFIPKPI